MSLFEKHKSIIEGNAPFGVVIENNNNKDVYVDFMGLDETLNNHHKKDGIKIYPLYKDLYFSSMGMLFNWILSKGGVLVDVTKFQSSLMFQMKKKYYLNIKHTDANGTQRAMPIHLEDNPNELLEYTKQLNTRFIITPYTSFGMTIDKYTDMVIKFYPQIKNKENFNDSFYNKIKIKDVDELNEEKRKRIRIII